MPEIVFKTPAPQMSRGEVVWGAGLQPLHNLSATLVLGDQQCGLLTECSRHPAFITPLSVCVSGAASGCVCFFLCLHVSVGLHVSVYVGLCRRAQCHEELVGISGRENTS